MTRRSRRSKARRAPRWRGLGGRLALLASSTAFAVLCLEVALRLALPPAPDPVARPAGEGYAFFTYHPRLGWDHVAGVEEVTKAPEFAVTVRLNDQGMRASRHYAPTAPAGVRRVVAVGDSFTFGHGVENDEVYVARLERAVPSLEVLNLAVTGYGVDQQWLKLEEQGLGYRPDVALLGLFEGDVFRNDRDEQLGYPKPRFVLDADHGLRLTRVPVPRVPSAANPSRTALGRVWSGPGRSLMEHLGGGVAWSLNEAILARAAEACRAASARLLVVVIPKDQAVYGSGLRRRLHERTLRLIDAQLARVGVERLDLTAGLRRAAGADPGTRLYFPSDGHWTAAGHAVAAELVADFLAPRLPPVAP